MRPVTPHLVIFPTMRAFVEKLWEVVPRRIPHQWHLPRQDLPFVVRGRFAEGRPHLDHPGEMESEGVSTPARSSDLGRDGRGKRLVLRRVDPRNVSSLVAQQGLCGFEPEVFADLHIVRVTKLVRVPVFHSAGAAAQPTARVSISDEQVPRPPALGPLTA